MIGHFLATQMHDEVRQTRYDGRGDTVEFVIAYG